ncbi:hypothetical protein WOLCODRAFT_165845 [Wolfiporia cocos MD-104 SS10]|uniref:Uncharacterized protein n=1 Tax=Wolfiporia cocos (strain MD-104) TaxID=742152 RepID=A0A2H3IXY6_WOLCO|nr:hypothetical protein WOLCODRAFT_165845 [Wolfiporia cocos MD-104 SS10]
MSDQMLIETPGSTRGRSPTLSLARDRSHTPPRNKKPASAPGLVRLPRREPGLAAVIMITHTSPALVSSRERTDAWKRGISTSSAMIAVRTPATVRGPRRRLHADTACTPTPPARLHLKPAHYPALRAPARAAAAPLPVLVPCWYRRRRRRGSRSTLVRCQRHIAKQQAPTPRFEGRA